MKLPAALQAYLKALAAAPNEQCGLMIGGEEVDQLLLSENLAKYPARAFEIDPALRLRVQRAAREEGRQVLGIFHTHPSGSVQPSVHDHESAGGEPGLIWAIATKECVALYRATGQGLVIKRS